MQKIRWKSGYSTPSDIKWYHRLLIAIGIMERPVFYRIKNNVQFDPNTYITISTIEKQK